jgi:hypothetical protein
MLRALRVLAQLFKLLVYESLIYRNNKNQQNLVLSRGASGQHLAVKCSGATAFARLRSFGAFEETSENLLTFSPA